MPAPRRCYSRAACDRVKENPPEQSVCQLGYVALCITHAGSTHTHTHSCSLPLYACGNLCSSFYLSLHLTLYEMQALEWHTRLNRLFLSSPMHHSFSSSLTPTLTVCQCVRVCDFKAGLPHCQLLWDYHIGDDWTMADRCLTDTHTHTHTYINRDRPGGVNGMLQGLTVKADNIKEAGSSLRLHVARMIMRPQHVPDI